ncbi:MAG TPA: hypothetical protein VMR62_33260 [Bryobacteraceae bacterium]|jgi:hypothetical protein|nr:hypothetical protein [Bryobacteraceae bacterium]
MTEGEFRVWHEKFLLPNATDEEVYHNILDIIDRSTGIADFYRSDPDAYDVESEIGGRPCVLRDRFHERDLRHLRRYFLRRYAFGRVVQVDRWLAARWKASRKSLWKCYLWLWKDYPMPRVGLAQILGLGVILGATGVFNGLHDIACRSTYFRLLVLGVFLALVWLLLYLHVRDRIGGPAKRVKQRTWGLFALCMIWPALGMLLEWLAGKPMGWTFFPWRAVLVNAAALVFALLSQFFFAKGATMGDPL